MPERLPTTRRASLNATTATDIFNNLVNRLEAPEMLAVERQGMRVMLASSRLAAGDFGR